MLQQLEVEVSSTWLHWKNVEQFCQVVKRDPDHFISFLKREMNLFSGSKAMVNIKVNKKDVTEMALKYVKRTNLLYSGIILKRKVK